MKKIIVTTTIQEPTKATKKFCEMEKWELIVVGDIKTPHREYEKLNCTYLHPDEQDKKYPELSKIIGWQTIQRRNIGFIEAYRRGADVIATIDDDNIPYEEWGENLCVGKEIEIRCFEPEGEVFDPLSITKANHLWHRGFPLELIHEKNKVWERGNVKRKVLIQADLWDGNPDVDAICRLTFRPKVKYDEITFPYSSNKIAPFSSQNTFLAREIIPYYVVFPYVGRMDDIWASYFVQCLFPDSVVFNRATVYQDRNKQDLITNLEKEIIGYRYSLSLIRSWQGKISVKDPVPIGIPEKAIHFYQIYRKQFNI